MRCKHPLGLFIAMDQEWTTRLKAAQDLNIPTAQILAPQESERDVSLIKKMFSDADIDITVVFCGFEGESYADIPTVKKSVGLVPKDVRAERLAQAKRIADFAQELGVSQTALHMGFIPEPHEQDYHAVVAVAKELAEHCQSLGQDLLLETGQEKARILLQFIEDVNMPNLAINFDPANMILYGSGDPIKALNHLGKYVQGVHCKDAKWAEHPGEEWGEEVPLGQGDVKFMDFFTSLLTARYCGPLTIEREIVGEQQIRDISRGVEYLATLRQRVWKE